MNVADWTPDPACGCFACKLEPPRIVSGEPELSLHLLALAKANATRGATLCGDEWEKLRSYLFRFRLPEWVEAALLQYQVDRETAETKLCQTFAVMHLPFQAVSELGPAPVETVDRLRAEIGEMREHYAQALARHGVVIG